MNEKMKKAEEKAKRYAANKERKEQKENQETKQKEIKGELADTNLIEDIETLFLYTKVMQSENNLLFPSFLSTNTKGFGMFEFIDTGYTTPDNVKLINELRNEKAVILAIIGKNKWISPLDFLNILTIKTSLNTKILAVHELIGLDLIVYFDNNISKVDIDLMYKYFHNSFTYNPN
jgi:hypothetical protein